MDVFRANRFAMITSAVLVVTAVVIVMMRTREPGARVGVQQPAVKPHSLRLDLIARIVAESEDDTIANLADPGDVMLVQSDYPGFLGSRESYLYASWNIPRLARVRKLLDIGKKRPGSLIVKLEAALRDAVVGYDRADRDEREAIAKAGGGMLATEPSLADKKAILSQASVYLLSELGSSKSLPLLVDIFESKERLPLSRAYLFHAMHRLIVEHPRAGLPDEAVAALQDYRADAGAIPIATKVHVPAWDASINESDYRSLVIGAPVHSERGPSITMHMLPLKMQGFEKVDSRGVPDPSPKLLALFAKAKLYVDKSK